MKDYRVSALLKDEQEANRLKKSLNWFCRDSRVNAYRWDLPTGKVFIVSADCTGNWFERVFVALYNGLKIRKEGRLCLLTK